MVLSNCPGRLLLHCGLGDMLVRVDAWLCPLDNARRVARQSLGSIFSAGHRWTTSNHREQTTVETPGAHESRKENTREIESALDLVVLDANKNSRPLSAQKVHSSQTSMRRRSGVCLREFG